MFYQNCNLKLAMALEGRKKLPTLRPSRDLKLTGGNKPKSIFTPNIPNNRKRPLPSSTSEGPDSRNHAKTADNSNKKVRPNHSHHKASNSQQVSDVRREREMKKRKNNVFVTTSIFSCGLAEKVVRKKDRDLGQNESLMESTQSPTPSMSNLNCIYS